MPAGFPAGMMPMMGQAMNQPMMVPGADGRPQQLTPEQTM